MSQREPIVWIEIDVDQCQLTYGSSPCTAVLGSTGDAKCFNCFNTCQDKDNYDLGSLTYKFYTPQANLPKEAGVFPCLTSVSSNAGEVNIAGTNPDIKGLGKREKISFTCKDFAYGDQYTDKYASERKSGAALASGIGYDPYQQGTFFGKLRARWPYYAGRACRYYEAYFDGGVLSNVVVSHYILTDMEFDVANDEATFEAKDILALLDDKNAVLPIANNGELAGDLGDALGDFTLTPTGIGDEEYDTSGRIVIGSEIMSFTRSGDVMTITGRGLNNTEVSSHSAGDSVQQTFRVDDQRIDSVLRDIMVDFGDIPSSFIPFTDWQDEASRWASTLNLTAEITKPTGVNTIIGEIVQLGVSVWWDRQAQEVGFKVNRPPDEDTIFDFNDQANIRSIDIDDRDEKRLTDIYFYTDIKSPIESVSKGDSYKRVRGVVDIDARSVNEFNDSKIRQVYMRWLGAGNDSLISIVGRRLLNRFRWSPSFYKFRVTYDPDLKLTDVIRVNSRISQNPDGSNLNRLMQAVSVVYDKPKHEMLVTAMTYQFNQRYGKFAPNSTPVYTSASEVEKDNYVFFADDVTKKMSDGSDAYSFS